MAWFAGCVFEHGVQEPELNDRLYSRTRVMTLGRVVIPQQVLMIKGQPSQCFGWLS